mgnify:CR=1 FL=1
MSNNKPIQLGLCCLNTVLRSQKPPVFASRSIILKTFEEKGFEHLRDKIIQNLKDVLTMMDWNELNGIKVFRLSSDLFPHMSNSKAPNYDFEFAKSVGNRVIELTANGVIDRLTTFDSYISDPKIKELRNKLYS